jgi:hypothetical protein
MSHGYNIEHAIAVKPGAGRYICATAVDANAIDAMSVKYRALDRQQETNSKHVRCLFGASSRTDADESCR